ncbi:hypothetical protein PV11_05599 [Exophiala sideris]|uniref:Uncharacterized protein n=1 Tax=Exophiala sideris TaxID=1016849 RepID=A0A0D1W4G2_9EURO|nr:hypothetical protein PV11_05599 [Exophiala sideris]
MPRIWEERRRGGKDKGYEGEFGGWWAEEKLASRVKVLSLERPKVGRQLGITAGQPKEDGHDRMGGLTPLAWGARLERRGERHQRYDKGQVLQLGSGRTLSVAQGLSVKETRGPLRDS